MWIILSIRETIFNKIIIQELLIYKLRYLQECNVLSSYLLIPWYVLGNEILNKSYYKLFLV